MQERVNEELRHIPRGDGPQNALRTVYNATRLADLKRDPDTPRLLSLRTAIARVMQQYPAFEPQYDDDYFSGKEV